MESFSLQANYIDLIILAILFYFISEAWRIGFWVILADFIGFLLSLLIALFGYSFAADILNTNFQLSKSVANAIGFLITAGFAQAILSFFFVGIIKRIPYKFWKKPWNNIAATFPALGQGLVIISFVLMLTVALPISPSIKSDLTEAKIGGFLIRQTSGLEASLNKVFGGLIEDSLTYLTVQPGSRESIPIRAESEFLIPDEVSEKEIFELANDERRKMDLTELVFRDDVVKVARDHARDMWERKYFGHVSPEGEDLGDRLEKEGIDYFVAGENLALAPTVQTAHTGLMNSEGHRENILGTDYKRLGVGVIENGVHGKIFVQIFTD